MFPVNIAHKFSLFYDYWHPRIVSELNDSYIKLVKLKGEFIWHTHEKEDELFLVINGKLIIKLKDREVVLEAGEFMIIPKGIEHMPIAVDEVQVMLIEPKSTVNTGEVSNERTVNSEWV
jgi:mannose-6-phosphate isomerase-like protein (cupin superfamily)